MRAWLAVFALTGCQSLFGVDEDPDRLPPDAASPDTGTITTECWGTDINVCVRPPPTTARMLAGTIDTGSMCDVVEDDLCIVAGTDVTVGNLRATGPRPLVVIAGGKLLVNGVLDAASHRTSTSGPGVGAANATCNSAAGPSYAPSGTGSGGGGGGGAGGTFAHAGGIGGGSVTAAAKGMAAAPATPAFRAGCNGQNGGIKTGITTIAAGGKGGGAVYLIAGTSIEVTGAINTSGAAGDSGKCICATDPTDETQLQNAESYGGAGGGSGGAIVLEAPAIAIKTGALVFADGGGGGQGASRSQPGEPGAEAAGETAALGGRRKDDGGTGPNNGGPGGLGSHAEIKLGTPGSDGRSNNIGGGGGGGGGAGYIKLIGPVTSTGAISPAP